MLNGRNGLAALKRKLDESKARTAEAHAQVEAKRNERAHRPVLQLRNEVMVEVVPKPPKVVGPKAKNATDVEAWFRDGLKRQNGDSYITMGWTVKQKTLAKNLLTAYGAELTEKAVRHLFDDWSSLLKRSGGKVSGVPTVNFLWGSREWVFAEVQGAGRKKLKNSDEFKPEEAGQPAKPRVGW